MTAECPIPQTQVQKQTDSNPPIPDILASILRPIAITPVAGRLVDIELDEGPLAEGYFVISEIESRNYLKYTVPSLMAAIEVSLSRYRKVENGKGNRAVTAKISRES